jgi:DNA replication protein DnaC
MLTNTTVEKLREMKLSTMARHFDKQLKDSEMIAMPFEDRFGMLVDIEWTTRQNNRLKRLIKSAGYSEPNATLADLDYRSDRELDKAQIERLGTCAYIAENRSLILLGATGAGKTYLANALGLAANQQFIKTKYVRLPEMLAELALAKVEKTYKKVMKVYKNATLLIIDEWVLTPLRDDDAVNLLAVVEARYKNGSTIFCSQFDVPGWHEKIGDDTLADAIVDRIVYNSYKIVIEGNDSMRKYKGLVASTESTAQ